MFPLERQSQGQRQALSFLLGPQAEARGRREDELSTPLTSAHPPDKEGVDRRPPTGPHCLLLSPHLLHLLGVSVLVIQASISHTPWPSGSQMLAAPLASTLPPVPIANKAMSDVTRLPGWGPACWHPGK